jgi:hypothetical protein
LASLVNTQLKRAPSARAVADVGRLCGLGPVASDEQPKAATMANVHRQRNCATVCLSGGGYIFKMQRFGPVVHRTRDQVNPETKS